MMNNPHRQLQQLCGSEEALESTLPEPQLNIIIEEALSCMSVSKYMHDLDMIRVRDVLVFLRCVLPRSTLCHRACAVCLSIHLSGCHCISLLTTEISA